VTDYDCWHEEEAPVSVEAVLAVLRKNAETADRVLARAVASLDPERPPDCDGAMRFAVLSDPAKVPSEARERLALLMERYWT
jgi:5'-methylthioadenosine phosphorylase